MWLTIDRQSQLTLTQQIYRQIQQMILSGNLKAEDKLPSTRKLSSQLAVSRNIVIDAYSQLIAEGYLKTYKGSRTVVTEGLQASDIVLPAKQSPSLKSAAKSSQKVRIDFRTGVPALEHFPRKAWGKLYQDVCNQLPAEALGYCKPSGIYELREAIAHYLYRTRGLTCDPTQIIITSGSTQGLSLVSNLLRDNKKTVLVEDPTHTGLRKVITKAGCSIEGIPVDTNGLRTDQLAEKKNVSFIYTTPSHQYPMGSVLSIQRRLALVRYAEKNDCYVVEDDYDGEFRYEGHPVSSLYELKPERVIYLGSFSKILAPALRLGFMILPEQLLAQGKSLKMYSDVHTGTLEQYTLTRFIQNGSFEKYIWKMKKHYSRTRSLLLDQLNAHFPNQFTILGHATGLHMVVRFHDKTFTKETIETLASKGVRIYTTQRFYLDEGQANTHDIVLGYAHLSRQEIVEGVGLIHEEFL